MGFSDMEEGLQLGRELLDLVDHADDAEFNVAKLDSLDEGAVLRRIPELADHGTAVDSGELGQVRELLAAVIIGEEGHLDGVAAASEEAGAGAGEVAGVSSEGGREALMYGAAGEEPGVVAADAAGEAASGSAPWVWVVVGLGDGGDHPGVDVKGGRTAVLPPPAAPALMCIEGLVGFGVEGGVHRGVKREGLRTGADGREEQKAEDGAEK